MSKSRIRIWSSTLCYIYIYLHTIFPRILRLLNLGCLHLSLLEGFLAIFGKIERHFHLFAS